MKLILATPLLARPGEGFRYSNDGYRLLAAIVERVSGQVFGAYLQAHLFEPAGMTSTGTYDDPRWAGRTHPSMRNRGGQRGREGSQLASC